MSSESLQLLVSAVRANFDARAPDPWPRPDWPIFMTLARRHRVEALAWRGMCKLGLTPPAAMQKVATDAVARQMRSVAEYIRLRDALAEQSVRHLFVKGAPLSALAWPEPQYKTSGDIDLLVDPADLATAATVLSALDYDISQPAHIDGLERWHLLRKESAWVHRSSGQLVDLHTRLIDNPALDSRLGGGARHIDIAIATDQRVPTLSVDDYFPYLCLHGASSAWFRLKWLADLAALIHRHRIVDMDRLHQRAVAIGAGGASAQALLMSSHYFGTDLPEVLLTPGYRQRALFSIARRQLQNGVEPTKRRGGTVMIRLSQALLFDRPIDGLSEVLRQLREISDRR